MPADPPPLPEWALHERFLAATGPGGQNVNKVATAVQLRLDVPALGLPASVMARLRALAGSRMTADGQLSVTARAHRTREANRIAARERIAALLAEAHVRPERRVRTRPTKASKERRLLAKTTRSGVKAARARPRLD
jgi:ribosome-associated protein